MTYKYFDLSEFDCSETGENDMKPEFLYALDQLREACGFPFTITSGYRSAKHSAERDKPNGPGAHARGVAADIRVENGADRMTLVRNALSMGFSGIGVAKTFVHVDIRATKPVLWTY
jgi:zinc D-Ala-D-Ala carboxypeptidase